MSKPTASDVHVNAPLTNMSVAYMQDAKNFIADRVFPAIPVAKQSDLYATYSKADFLRDEVKVRAPGTESAGGGYGLDHTASYAALVYALHKDVSDQLRANADSHINPDRDATEYLSQLMLIRKDASWATKFFATGKWATDVAGVAGAPAAAQFKQWDQAGSTPLVDIRTQAHAVLKVTGRLPNKLVLGVDTFGILCDHADMVDRIKHTQTAVVTEELMASLFGLDEVLVSRATNNTAAEGAAATMAFIANGKAALLVYANPKPSLLTPSGGYTFNWTGLTGSGPNGARIKRFRMDHLEADRIEAEMAWDQKLVASDCGVFFAAAVA